jgi:CheY-like chemotaxis protein
MAKVLVADDSVAIQKVVEFILSERGYDLKVVGTPDAAIEQASEFGPDVILVDINMPGLTGYKVAEEIRANPLTRDVSIILLAGAFEPVDFDKVEAAGINDTLIKPFEADDLLRKIQALLARGGGAPAQAAAAKAAPAPPKEEEEFVFFGPEDAEEEAVEADVFEAEVVAEAPAPPRPKAAEPRPAPAAPVKAAPVAAAISGPSAHDVTAALTASIERAVAQAFAKADIPAILERAAAARIGALLDGMDIHETLTDALTVGIRDTVERTLLEVVPELAEGLLREKLGEALTSVRSEIENIIWETVPELAEKIITEEIDKIKARG